MDTEDSESSRWAAHSVCTDDGVRVRVGACFFRFPRFHNTLLFDSLRSPVPSITATLPIVRLLGRITRCVISAEAGSKPSSRSRHVDTNGDGDGVVDVAADDDDTTAVFGEEDE